MKKSIYIAFLALIFSLMVGCKSKTVFVPVESVRVEYRDKLERDSIYLKDSIFVREKGDSILIEKFRYLYKDRLVHDSIFLRDTIRVPFPVIEEVEVNKISGFQNFQMWCGRILLIFLLGFLGFKCFRFFR